MDHRQTMIDAYHAEAARLFKAAEARQVRVDPAFSVEKRAAYRELEEKLGAENMDKIAFIMFTQAEPIEKLAFIGALAGLLARIGPAAAGLAERLGLKTLGSAAASVASKAAPAVAEGAGAAAKAVATKAVPAAVEGAGAAATKAPSWFSGMAAKRGLTPMEGGQLYGKMQSMGPMEFAKQRMFRKAVEAPMLNPAGKIVPMAGKAKAGGLWPEVRSNIVMGGAMGLTQRMLEKPDENKQVVYGY